MKPTLHFIVGSIFLASIIAAGGCGQSNTRGPMVDSSGKHLGNWIIAHRSAFRQSSGQCQDCHGADLRGGITRIDCFNQQGLGMCHANGHGPRFITHPLPFKSPALHGPPAKQDLTECQGCHGETGGPGSNPRFNVVIGTLAAGCESPGCHQPKMAHPKPWLNHENAGNITNACTLCHGSNFNGGSGPACSACHSSLQAGKAPTLGECVSCHSAPPDGTTPPNRALSHPPHAALPEVQNNCVVCHMGGGLGTPPHKIFGNLTTAILPVYDAKTGPAAFDKAARTCSNVRCHGGVLTPSWGGAIDVQTQCGMCHVPGTSQYNSYFSGAHQKHVFDKGIGCTACHDPAKLTTQLHFGSLSSAGFSQPPAATVQSNLNYVPLDRSCSPVCHSTRFWLP